MGKLYEVLAVEQDRKKTYDKIIAEAKNTFGKKPGHFTAWEKSLKFFDDQKQQIEQPPIERFAMVTTVKDKLDYLKEGIGTYLDTVYQKELSNQKAKGTLMLDGEIFGEGLPATFLLGMETKLVTIRNMLLQIPTLPPSLEWEKAESEGEGIYKRKHAEITYKTQKDFKSRILVKPTKEHPAQIEKWSEDINVAQYTKEEWSGMLSPTEKSQMLARLDNLLSEIKQARQRANDIEAPSDVFGQKILAYIFDGKK